MRALMLFIAAQALSLAALIVMQVETTHRRDDYTRFKEYGPVIEERYRDYRRAYQTRNMIGYITLGIYFANYVDALLAPVTPKK